MIPKVTVLMPSLNVVKYISPCMESVIAQTLHDIEILVIDAGSDDGTLEILRKYEESDSRVKIIHSNRKSYGYQIFRTVSSRTCTFYLEFFYVFLFFISFFS